MAAKKPRPVRKTPAQLRAEQQKRRAARGRTPTVVHEVSATSTAPVLGVTKTIQKKRQANPLPARSFSATGSAVDVGFESFLNRNANTSNAAVDDDVFSKMNDAMGRATSMQIEKPNAGAHSAQQRPSDRYLATQLPSPPLDWGIKRRVRFHSPHSFIWCSRPSARNTAKARNIHSRRNNKTISDHPDEKEVCFHLASLYYRYPSTQLSETLLEQANQAALKAEHSRAESEAAQADMINLRQTHFEEAFRSLYYSVRYGYLHYFYMRTEMHTVLFVKNRNDEPITALLTRSTRALREKLRKSGTTFSQPLMATGLSAASDSDEEVEEREPQQDDEWDELERKGVNIRKGHDKHFYKKDKPGTTMVMFRGQEQVHNLYDYFMNRPRRIYKHLDVPTLLAPDPFLHGTMQRTKITQNVATRKLVNFDKGQDTTYEDKYMLEFQGEILPTCLIKLCHTFQNSQNGEFEVETTHDKLSEALNCVIDVPNLQPEQLDGQDCTALSAIHELKDRQMSMVNGLRRIKCASDSYWVGLAPVDAFANL